KLPVEPVYLRGSNLLQPVRAEERKQGHTVEESVKPNLKSRDGISLPNPNWKLVPQKRGLKTEGSASHSTFKYSRNNK
ncbi:hypothetical protein ACYTX9_09255, partial [Streptococcus pyogenes]